jgi:isopentenyl diphosphate isomerase/L-lactate dehydrogenase-like FMN-dependent dehydrogenase
MGPHIGPMQFFMNPSYLAPAVNQIPAAIQSAQDYVDVAREFIGEACYEYITGGSGRGVTASANLAAFDALTVCPRVLREIGGGNTHVKLPDATLVHPILLAPVAYQTLAHPGGERETARGAHVTDTCIVASTLSTCTLEDIATAAADTPKWFQLYFQSDAAVTQDLVRRAESAGFSAIVVTLDGSLQVPNHRAFQLGFRFPQQLIAGNLERYAASSRRTNVGEVAENALTWKDLKRLRSETSLPIWAKGVLHPDDARELKAFGMAGIIVSNHGGRGLDGAPASLHALPKIRAVVGNDYPLLLDGGIRSGLDVFKAIARGADAVLVGRLQMYALSVAGALGVAHMVRLLREELAIAMSLAGCATLRDIRSAMLE